MPEQEKFILTIDGMHCNHCVQAVTGALSTLLGVSTVDVVLDKGTATVTGTGIDEKALILAIEDIGFDVTKIEK